MPRVAAEPFMRVVGEMLDLEEQAAEDDRSFTDAIVVDPPSAPDPDKAISTPEPAEIAVPDRAPEAVPVADRALDGGQAKHRNRVRKE